MNDRRAAHPPKLPFVLPVGITGHRSEALPADSLPRLIAAVTSALDLLVERAEALHAGNRSLFAAGKPRIHFVSPLAAGADQIAAEVAAERGWPLQAVLPFPRNAYRAELPSGDAGQRFDRLLGLAECVLELPGERQQLGDAYVLAGRATIAHCDVLLALWDGLPARGPGGTADVVQMALQRGTAVIHIPVAEAGQPRLLWSGFDPSVITDRVAPAVERPLAAEHLDSLLRALLLPPADPAERHFLALFESERVRRIRARIEYPLLLAAAGVSRFPVRNMRESHCAAAIRDEWQRYREGCGAREMPWNMDLLERCYSWSDQLATRYAQTYRSGHIFNFVLGGIAVCLGLSAFMAPGATLELAVAEFIITALIIINTRVGVRTGWHRRWLDYRQLAERLRPMRSLKLLGVAAPDPAGTAANPVPKRWIDWYASAVWRAMGCPGAAIDEAAAQQLARAVATHELAPQVAYHERSAQQVDLLDRRLESIATLLFWATLIVCVAVAGGLAIAPDWVGAWNDWFTLISAGFPALGTAVFGIRFQGDFGGSANRSQATADALRRIEAELSDTPPLGRAADLTEQAARTMLADLDEWRLVNQQQELDLA